MSDVAATVKMSLRTVYGHCPGKADLFTAIVEPNRRSLVALPGDHDDYSCEDALLRIFQVGIAPEPTPLAGDGHNAKDVRRRL